TLCRRPGHKGDLGRDLEDLMQEVFVRLFAENARALRAWDPDRGLSLVGFVRMVADREVSNVFASGRRQPSAERLELEENMDLHARSTAPDEERRAIDRDLLLKVYRELQTWLTPRGRELFTVVYLEERPLEEVAERFEMKRGALYAWRNRVGRKARSLLEKLQSEDQHVPRRAS
ncbi:MAG: sigma-70 family RNA polymerase sigma factor, partial [Myxococcota bacterium]